MAVVLKHDSPSLASDLALKEILKVNECYLLGTYTYKTYLAVLKASSHDIDFRAFQTQLWRKPDNLCACLAVLAPQ